MKNFFTQTLILLCNVLTVAYVYLLLIAIIIASAKWSISVLLGN